MQLADACKELLKRITPTNWPSPVQSMNLHQLAHLVCGPHLLTYKAEVFKSAATQLAQAHAAEQELIDVMELEYLLQGQLRPLEQRLKLALHKALKRQRRHVNGSALSAEEDDRAVTIEEDGEADEQGSDFDDGDSSVAGSTESEGFSLEQQRLEDHRRKMMRLGRQRADAAVAADRGSVAAEREAEGEAAGVSQGEALELWGSAPASPNPVSSKNSKDVAGESGLVQMDLSLPGEEELAVQQRVEAIQASRRFEADDDGEELLAAFG